jgi:hypothetical protein
MTNAANLPDFEEFFFPKLPDFCDELRQVAKNIEGFWFFSNDRV